MCIRRGRTLRCRDRSLSGLGARSDGRRKSLVDDVRDGLGAERSGGLLNGGRGGGTRLTGVGRRARAGLLVRVGTLLSLLIIGRRGFGAGGGSRFARRRRSGRRGGRRFGPLLGLALLVGATAGLGVGRVDTADDARTRGLSFVASVLELLAVVLRAGSAVLAVVGDGLASVGPDLASLVRLRLLPALIGLSPATLANLKTTVSRKISRSSSAKKNATHLPTFRLSGVLWHLDAAPVAILQDAVIGFQTLGLHLVALAA